MDSGNRLDFIRVPGLGAALRSRWGRLVPQAALLVLALVCILLWAYEWLDLWASPSRTAWLVLGYFAAATITEAAFRESPFCKYLCPLGAFNTLYATASWLKIGARNRQRCRGCAHSEA